ncbi:isoprenylcysteine carboxylmethyltransferase family protein [Cyanobium sp. Morenito 9A2]|uniref:methyltransferase family protein n=1 Tax=Cyanobium sp. Morenito 9A2 TaxID=2823718 RepID=UPI0020CD8214|nr:isoprenylcysteine carboxylmethyltransferase family protein [Cyanobium sp. Morenito 9A2]MCP9849532.1 isoprenylcysteine carboxylmethyltransferase family protein [Cyanobium sp. Morenito 9A2]
MTHPLSDALRAWGLTWGGWLDNRRGEWWLLAQLVLIALLLLPAVPAPSALGLTWPLAVRLVGAVAVALGVVEGLRAFLNLGSSLTPLPDPKPGAALVTTGPYARVRHPLYQAILIGALGMALARGSLLHLGLLLALVGVLGGKARREENKLLAEHPEYTAYRASTAAIVPGLPWLDWRA